MIYYFSVILVHGYGSRAFKSWLRDTLLALLVAESFQFFCAFHYDYNACFIKRWRNQVINLTSFTALAIGGWYSPSACRVSDTKSASLAETRYWQWGEVRACLFQGSSPLLQLPDLHPQKKHVTESPSPENEDKCLLSGIFIIRARLLWKSLGFLELWNN